MEYYSLTDIYYADACFALMLTGLICSFIRLRQMYQPFDKSSYYPAGKLASLFFATHILQFPYFLCPSDEGIWLYVRIYGIIIYPVCFAMLFMRYFQRNRLRGVKNRLYCWLPMAVVGVLFALSISGYDGWVERNRTSVCIVAGGISIILFTRLLFVVIWLKKKIDKYNKDNYSNEEDFPYYFADKVIWLPLIWILFMWVIFLSDSRDVKMMMDVILTVWNVVFLCTILNSQRPVKIEDEAKRIAEDELVLAAAAEKSSSEHHHKVADLILGEVDETDGSEGAEPETGDEVKRLVLAVILRRYRESHLLKTEVLSEIDKGMVAAASRFIASVGYYNLINMFRLRYAQLYLEAHPGAKLAEVAEASGYISDSALIKARKNVSEIDLDLVGDVSL